MDFTKCTNTCALVLVQYGIGSETNIVLSTFGDLWYFKRVCIPVAQSGQTGEPLKTWRLPAGTGVTALCPEYKNFSFKEPRFLYNQITRNKSVNSRHF